MVMSSEEDQVRQLAERIARRVSQTEGANTNGQSQSEIGNGANDELRAMRAALDELQKRLASIESHITRDKDSHHAEAYRATNQPEQKSATDLSAALSPGETGTTRWLSGVYFPATHPSTHKFKVEEAAVAELVDFFEKEKTCTMEPGGKPCDQCAMCSSRGF